MYCSVKKSHVLIITTLMIFLFVCCGRAPFDRKFHTVTSIVDGNTIKVDRRVTINLIGVDNTHSAEDFLEKYVLNKKVRVKFDRKKREVVKGRYDEVWAYVVTHDRISVNGELLKRQLCNLSTTYLNDSLRAFEMYAKGMAYNPDKANQNRLPKNDRNESSSYNTESVDLPELVDRLDDAVFMVFTYDENENMIGTGTGFFIDGDGTGVSNYHVFEDGSEWYIKTLEGDVYRVDEIVTGSSYRDYIIFTVENNSGYSFPYLQFANGLPSKGEDIFVIGNPQGLESTLTRGVVSAIRSINSDDDFIQIDAAISPGSSGSPVMNMGGKVVGIATQKRTECENCNYALNIEFVEDALRNQ